MKGGLGTYSEISRNKEKMKDVNKDQYFDVYGPEMTDWSTPYTPEEEIDLDIGCIKKSIENDYQEEFALNPSRGYISGHEIGDYTTNKYGPAVFSNINSQTALEGMDDISSEEFWYNNPNELVDCNKLLHVIPQRYYTIEENMNAIARFGIIFAIFMAFYKKNIKYLLLLVLVLIFTIYLYVNKINSMDAFSGLFYRQNPKKKEIIVHQFVEDEPMIDTTDVEIVNNEIIDEEDPEVVDNYFKKPKRNIESFYAATQNGYSENTVYNKGHKNEYAPYGKHQLSLDSDYVCANNSQNETTGGYDWIKQSSQADFRSNSRLLKTPQSTKEKMFTDITQSYGREIADRNSYIATHPRDFINTNMDEFLYGKNLDRRLYYGRR